ncbi:MAG: DUF1194 domain-containing protein [Pseudomonadota bacterium]
MRALMAAALAAVVATGSGAERAQAEECGLELILALDVSGSVDRREYALQIGGLAAAFEDDRVGRVIDTVDGGILVTMTQWSGASRQSQSIGWHHVTDDASRLALAAAIRAAPRTWRNFSTALGEALVHAHAIGADAPMACRRKVIDVSGDGVSNEGRPPGPVSLAVAASGYTINALVIRGAVPDPVEHFEHQVIAGPAAFIEIAEGFDDYPEAILRKLLREIDRPMIVSDRR